MMKKLSKLHINAERMMKNEDLLNIKGGEYENACTCQCVEWDPFGGSYIQLGYFIAPDGNCYTGCQDGFSHDYKYAEGICIGR